MRRLKSRLLALGLLVLGIGLAPLPAAEAACSISECMGSCVYEEPRSYQLCVRLCQFECRQP